MPIPILAYWCNQAVKYTLNRNEEITEDYIAVVKEPRYAEAPEYQNEDTRAQFLRDRGLRMLRKYQVNSLKALQSSVREGNQRFRSQFHKVYHCHQSENIQEGCKKNQHLL